MKKRIVLSVASVIVISCSFPGNRQDAAQSGLGERVYKNYCIACHGIYGDMGGSGAFDLTVSALSLEERIQVVSEGRNLMTPFKEILNEEEIKAVAGYIETLRK